MQEKDKKQNNSAASEKFIEYIDAVNYQLREPVASIFASLPIMADNINSNRTEEALENLEAVQRRTYSVMKSINNLSLVSKLQGGYEYNKEIIDFSQLTESAFQSSRMVMPSFYSLKCEIDDGCIISGSKSLLSVAIFNILHNSFEYRKEDVQVSVSLKKEEKRCVLTYRDNSKGMKPEIAAKVFEPFYSADPYNDGAMANRLGLGLYIAKKAVTHADGTIFIQSEFDKGVNIVISIPLLDEDASSLMKSKPVQFMLNKYSDMYVQLCEYCSLPDLI